MSSPKTLWELTLTWPCDYAQIEKGRETAEGKKTPIAMSVHLEKCRRCSMQKQLLLFDELLRRTAMQDYETFVAATQLRDDEATKGEFLGIIVHAQVVRTDMLGCPGSDR